MFQSGDFPDMEMQNGAHSVKLSLTAPDEHTVHFKQSYRINVYKQMHIEVRNWHDTLHYITGYPLLVPVYS
jgi:hypothetical protein